MDNLYISKSNIHGFGLFSLKYYKINDIILYNCIDNNTHEISELARYVNHSYKPNSMLFYDKSIDGYHLIALKNINISEEITGNYNHSPSFIKKPNSDWI